MDEQRKKDLAKIHIAKKQLGLDDAIYRAMLQSVAGVESAADLDDAGRRKVLAHLAKVGFKTRSGKGASKYPGRPNFANLEGTGKLAMMRKIEAYLAEAKRPWEYAHNIALQMHDHDRLEWCNHAELRAVIVALEKDARRWGRFTG